MSPAKKSVKTAPSKNGRQTAKRMKNTKVPSSPELSLSKSITKKKASRQSAEPDRAEVEHRAWEIWQREGCPAGRELDHWLQAEQELRFGK